MSEQTAQPVGDALADLTHYEMFLAPEMARTVLPFLDGKSGSTSWAEQVNE
jgi:hypothetical protein